jgi:hypothetical protein
MIIAGDGKNIWKYLNRGFGINPETKEENRCFTAVDVKLSETTKLTGRKIVGYGGSMERLVGRLANVIRLPVNKGNAGSIP